MRTHQLASFANRYNDGIGSPTVLVHNGFRFGVAGWTQDQQGRKEFGEDMVAGPWAYVYGLCVVLSASPAGRTDFSNDVPVAEGDRVEFGGAAYTVKVLGREHITLVPVPVLKLAGATGAHEDAQQDAQPSAGGFLRGEPGYFRALAQQTTDVDEREMLLQDAADEQYRRDSW